MNFIEVNDSVPVLADAVVAYYHDWVFEGVANKPQLADVAPLHASQLFGEAVRTYSLSEGLSLVAFGSIANWAPEQGVARLFNIFVVPEKRGEGHGVSIVRSLENVARKESLQYMTLRADDESEQFYSDKLGYGVLKRVGLITEMAKVLTTDAPSLVFTET